MFPPHHCDRIGIRGSTSAQRILHKTYAPKVVENASPLLCNNRLDNTPTVLPILQGFNLRSRLDLLSKTVIAES